MKYEGDLVCKNGEDYSQITEISGFCYARGYTGAFPKLTSIGGSCYARGYTGAFPKLTSIGGSCYARGYTGAFPKLTSIGGSCYARGYTGAFPKLTSIGGSCYARGYTGAFPKLTSIGGFCYARGYTGAFPKLTSIGGFCNAEGYTGAFPKLTSIGGFCYARGYTGAFPKLTSIGGFCNAEGYTGAFHKDLKTNDPDAEELCRQMLFASFLSSGYIFADSILSKLISKKVSRGTTVYIVQICGRTEKSVVIEKNGQYSHGKTIKEAKESLIFKITDRDTTRFKAWKLNTKISAADAVAAYRAITGACEFGVKNFCQDKDLSKTYTPKEIIKLTTGSYGHDAFKQFFSEAA